MTCGAIKLSYTQVHGLASMGGSDLHPEAQVGGSEYITSDVLSQPQDVLDTWRYKQTESSHGRGIGISDQIWPKGRHIFGYLRAILFACRGKICPPSCKLLYLE